MPAVLLRAALLAFFSGAAFVGQGLTVNGNDGLRVLVEEVAGPLRTRIQRRPGADAAVATGPTSSSLPAS